MKKRVYFSLPVWAAFLQGWISLIISFLILMRLFKASSTYQSVSTMDPMILGICVMILLENAISSTKCSIPDTWVSKPSQKEDAP